MRAMTKSRRGFTLIEMLWVIFIITILISLLLPAVQSSREEARRVQCTNNLLQFSLAARSYETTHRVYPPGVVDTTGPIFHAPPGYHASWIVQLLPYLEKKAVQFHIRPEFGVYHPVNSTVTSIALSGFNCPSAPLPYATSGGSFLQPVTSYAACHSGTDERIDVDNNGVFFLNSHVTDDDILDGLGTTIFFGEKYPTLTQLGWASGTRATLRNMGYDVNKSPEVMANPNSPMSPFDDPTPSEETGSTNPAAAKVIPGRTGGFSSYHRSGANFAFGDGSVRFIKNGVDRDVYRRLGQRNDGALISEGSF